MDKIITKIGNIKLIHPSKSKYIHFIKKAINSALKKNYNIYKYYPDKFSIIICDKEEDYLKETKYKKIGGGACVKWNKIILLTSKKDYKSYEFILFHEINHLLYKKVVGHIKPIWLAEGLAMLNQEYYKPLKITKVSLKKDKISWRYLSVEATKFKTIDERKKFYALSYFSLMYLIKRHGIGKIINFLNKVPNPYKDYYFWKIFQKEFQIDKIQLTHKSLE